VATLGSGPVTPPVLVVGPRAAALETALAEAMPSDVHLSRIDTVRPLTPSEQDAEIALGPPDQLAPMLSQLPRLRWVQSTWAGVTPFIDHPRRDYQLTAAKGMFGAAMSEYVLGWVLALERSILRHATARHWDDRPDRGVGDKRLGIAGVGSIGREVALRCAPFFDEVVGLNSDGHPVEGCRRCYGMDQRFEFARGLDVLALLLPQTEQTTRLADDRLLDALNPGAIVMNAGRANALDLPAALQHLESGGLSALVLDVLAEEPLEEGSELWSLPGLYLTSHTAAPTETHAIARQFLDNLGRYRRGEPLHGLVDFTRGY